MIFDFGLISDQGLLARSFNTHLRQKPEARLGAKGVCALRALCVWDWTPAFAGDAYLWYASKEDGEVWLSVVSGLSFGTA